MSQRTFKIICLCALMSASAFVFFACEKKELPPPEPLPAMVWTESQTQGFVPRKAWNHAEKDWSVISETLHYNIVQPEAVETHLLREEREIWKEALTYLGKAQEERKSVLILANLQFSEAEVCAPMSLAFTLQQRSQIQLALQLHRNILWRIGRLEMASRGISTALRAFLDKYKNNRNADAAITAPLLEMVAQIDSLRANHPLPHGVWDPGELHFRIARNAHAESIFIQTKTLFETWKIEIENSKRWHYLANTADPVIEAISLWCDEFSALILAFRSFAAHAQTLEREFAPPHSLVAWPCINKNLKQLRIISELYSHILPMQYHLSLAMDDIRTTMWRLKSLDYDGKKSDYLMNEAEKFLAQIEDQKSGLARAEDLLLVSWDQLNEQIWRVLPDFTDPIHHPVGPAVENIEKWNLLYAEIKNELSTLPRGLPEPEQPTRRGKTLAPYISMVIETLHAPSRIDEGERGLLAISELEAHMLSIRDELMKLCKQGACRSFPEAEVANSPRTSPWIVSWRQSPSAERTLGHTLVVIKLCQLHLGRLVQRLAEIYAWFSETSNADLSWKKLKAWQRIWTLYAESNGTYANFLRSVALLDQNIKNMAQPQSTRAESETLLALLSIQGRLFDLTLDYARLIDQKNTAPTSFDELVTTWEDIDERLIEIEKATLERDEKLHPERIRANKRVVDIPR